MSSSPQETERLERNSMGFCFCQGNTKRHNESGSDGERGDKKEATEQERRRSSQKRRKMEPLRGRRAITDAFPDVPSPQPRWLKGF